MMGRYVYTFSFFPKCSYVRHGVYIMRTISRAAVLGKLDLICPLVSCNLPSTSIQHLSGLRVILVSSYVQLQKA